MKAIRCAGLHWHGACQKQQQCANHAKWWQVDGVQFNACSGSTSLKHFAPIGTLATAAPQIIQQELFA